MRSFRATTRRLRHLAGGRHLVMPRWALHDAMFQQATLIVAFFYVATAFYLYYGSRALSHIVDNEASLDLLWPVAWMPSVGLERAGKLIAHLGLSAGLLGLVAWRFIAVRIMVSVALLLYAAFENSYGAISHGEHEWFWMSVCFWLLPTGRTHEIAATRTTRMQFLTAFSLAPLLILLFYTLSGFYKCGYALVALLEGRVGGFSPDAMAITLAQRAFQTGSQPMWADFAIDYPWLSWPFYLGLYFVELVSIVVFFRPQLHRAWGMVLIMFHFGTLLFMDITFPKHVLINGMLFVMSPFALGAHLVHHQLENVPVLGWLYRPIRSLLVTKPKSVPMPESAMAHQLASPVPLVTSMTQSERASRSSEDLQLGNARTPRGDEPVLP